MFDLSSIALISSAFLFSSSALALPVANESLILDTRDTNPFQTTLDPLSYAPDFSKDPFPPYPSTKDANGKDLTAQNWRSTRLFGWKGCDTNANKIIKETWDDFYKLAQQDTLYKNIDWDSQAAKDIWGHATGNKAISDDTKKQIKQIYQAAQQMYDAWWAPPYDDITPPGTSWRWLWIEVACAPDGDDTNFCGDKPVKVPQDQCPSGYAKPQNSGKVEAYSNPLGTYSKITFCNYFFNAPEMRSLSEVIANAKAGRSDKTDLWSFQNRARVFFHEVTHLNYFMNAPDQSPYVDDLIIDTPAKKGDNGKNKAAYGPDLIKTLANYEAVNKGGFFTQRNADSYAWFAVAKYVEKMIGSYPTKPIIKSRPARAPRDGDNKNFAAADLSDTAAQGDWDGSFDHNVPGCSDTTLPGSNAVGVASISKGKASCDNTNALSGIPYNVFGSHTTGVYAQFCAKLDSSKKFAWTVDSHGYQKAAGKTKRTPPPNPDSYSSFSFNLLWEPSNAACTQTYDSCLDAFANIENSPCGHQAGEQNIMTAAAKFAIDGCGTYSYTITGPNVPPPVTPAPAAPGLGPQQCVAAFSGHSDTQGDAVSSAASSTCSGLGGHMITTDPATWVHKTFAQGTNRNSLQFDITWASGCKSPISSYDAGTPLSGSTCVNLLTQDYKSCNNGGVGGSVTAGCVNYSFKLGEKQAPNPVCKRFALVC